jgi:RNA polymerase sigma factor (sigma-70 family)
MSAHPGSTLLRLLAGHETHELSDAGLLHRFVARRDEAAFADLLRRHGPGVWGLCRRLLAHEQDAEDAFQATFLLLARQAGSIRTGDSVGGWLQGVARRIAVRTRQNERQRRQREREASSSPQVPGDTSALAWAELQTVLEEELARLPERYRRPFVLCCPAGWSGPGEGYRSGWPGAASACRPCCAAWP